MQIFALLNFRRVVQRVIEIAFTAGAIAWLGIFSWTGVTFSGALAVLAVAFTSWLLLSVRSACQAKYLTGSFFQSACPMTSLQRWVLYPSAIVVQLAAVVVAAALFPSLFAVSGVGVVLVAVFAFIGAVLSNIPNKLLTKLVKSA